MEKTLHTNLFLNTIYKDGNEKKHSYTRKLIASDWNLREAYLEIKETVEALPKASFSPSASVINSILGHSLNSPIAVR